MRVLLWAGLTIGIGGLLYLGFRIMSAPGRHEARYRSRI